MENVAKKLLPIGTVVQLKDREQKVMICGRQQVDIDDNVEYDYIGCEYPKGLDGENILLFDADNIALVYFLGYQDLDEVHQRFVLIENME